LSSNNFRPMTPELQWKVYFQNALWFIIASAIVWIIAYTAYINLPYVRNGASLISEAKVELLETQPVFSSEAQIRVLAFGNSRILAGFNPRIFDETLEAKTNKLVQSYNAGRPGDRLYVQFLKKILDVGTRPTHVISFLSPTVDTPLRWTDYFLHDKLMVNFLFPFRDMPRDLITFIGLAQQRHGLRAAYRESRDTVQIMLHDRGYYFIKGQSTFPNDRLPDNYHLPQDGTQPPPDTELTPGEPAFRELIDLSRRYGFKIIFIPGVYRQGEFLPVDPAIVPKPGPLAEEPNVIIAGPRQLFFPNRYFSDPVHLNPEGADLYSRQLAEMIAPFVSEIGK